nr:hypothetical protein [Cohnella faecalis]
MQFDQLFANAQAKSDSSSIAYAVRSLLIREKYTFLRLVVHADSGVGIWMMACPFRVSAEMEIVPSSVYFEGVMQ